MAGKNKPKVIVYESDPGVEITGFKTSEAGKGEKIIKRKDWGDDPKRLRKEAEKI